MMVNENASKPMPGAANCYRGDAKPFRRCLTQSLSRSTWPNSLLRPMAELGFYTALTDVYGPHESIAFRYSPDRRDVAPQSLGVPGMEGQNDRYETSRRIADILARRWAMPVILALANGPERFGTLQRRLPGVVHKVLTDHLRFLERVDVVERVASGVSNRPVYRLSTKGLSLLPVIAAVQALEKLWDLPAAEN